MKNILIIVPYRNIYPPMNGGMLRCFHILRQLSKNFSVTAITHQSAADFEHAKEVYPELTNCKFICTQTTETKTDAFSVLPSRLRNALRYRYWKRTLKGPADSNFLAYYLLLASELRKQRFDAVILENLSTLNAVPLIRRFDKNVPIIYDAHNFDTALAEDALKKDRLSFKSYKDIKMKEARMHEMVQTLIACSDHDKKQFESVNLGMLRCYTIPNGVDTKSLKPDTQESRGQHTLLFCGSMDYEPNQEGLIWFFDNCWEQLLAVFPAIELVIVGSGAPGENLARVFSHPNIHFVGRVPELRTYYHEASLSIVPLHSGSGTRLKILEAMSFGVPVISTPKGAEGIGYAAGKNILIGEDAESFTTQIINALSHQSVRNSVARHARELVEQQYDWDVIGEQLKNIVVNQ